MGYPILGSERPYEVRPGDAGKLSISTIKGGHRGNKERFRSIYAPNPEDASSTPTSEETELYSSPEDPASEFTQTEANALGLCSAQWRKRKTSSAATRRKKPHQPKLMRSI